MSQARIEELFAGRTLVIATQHHKEKVLGPIFSEALGVKIIVPSSLDTDRLGTFSGEVERMDDPITTARKKCELALANTEFDLALASEGSFGAHPNAFFLPANEEWLVLVDQKNGIEISIRQLSLDTNFAGEEIKSLSELEEFSDKAGFPSHGLILRKAKEELLDLHKGIIEPKKLDQLARSLLEKHGSLYVETDMRAMFNPSRMKVIEQTGRKLIAKILDCCPACDMPGFGIVSYEPGLPCSWCGQPTRAILAAEKVCSHCQHQERVMYPEGKTSEDPMYCDRCNP